MALCIVETVKRPVKCKKCGTLYLPEKIKENGYFENCPTCKFCFNGKDEIIPIWKYNLIKWKRETFKL